MTGPRHTHDVEQLRARLREMARALTAFREELLDGGMDEARAFALVQHVEELWSGIIFAQHEGRYETEAWEKVLDLLREKIDNLPGGVDRTGGDV